MEELVEGTEYDQDFLYETLRKLPERVVYQSQKEDLYWSTWRGRETTFSRLKVFVFILLFVLYARN